MSTIQSRLPSPGALRARARRRPLALAAVAIVAAESTFAAAGAPFPVLSACALLLAPGLALAPALPKAVRDDPLATLAAAPALAFAASSVLLVTAAAAGMPLEPLPIRLLLLGFVIAAFAAPLGPDLLRPLSRTGGRVAAALGAVLAIGIVLQAQVIGGYPVPGNDWAKYLLYADEIRRHGSLLIDNPFWLLGVPFREDPGAPALYGGYLVLGDQPTTALAHGIWPFAVGSILAAFAFTRTFWGPLAGVLAAAFWATMPMTQDILGWHGLANVAALLLLPLVLLYLGTALTGRATRTDMAGFALAMVGLAAAHRLSFAVGLGTVGAGLAVAMTGRDRRLVGRRILEAGGIALLLGAGVAYDLWQRSKDFGGNQGYEAYLSQKVDLEPVIRDLSIPFSIASAIAIVLAAFWVRRDRSLVPPLAAFAVAALLAYAWVVHLPLFYIRMAYFLPVALTPLVAIALVRLLRPVRAAIAGAALAVAMAVFAFVQAPDVRGLYEFATPGSLRGLDALEAELEPGDVVVTDRCWSFLATWLLRNETLAALEPADIQPKAEVELAETARKILAGTPEGQELARELGVRYLVVNPTCTDTKVRALPPPVTGTAVYVQEDLVIVELPATSASPGGLES